jgi:hypothetical protein
MYKVSVTNTSFKPLLLWGGGGWGGGWIKFVCRGEDEYQDCSPNYVQEFGLYIHTQAYEYTVRMYCTMGYHDVMIGLSHKIKTRRTATNCHDP